MNPVINVPLAQVMRSEIALPLGHILNIHTVGQFVRAWYSPRNQKSIEQIFDTPEQARHAASICSTWVGATNHATTMTPNTWWINDDSSRAPA
ncbi:MAG: hypothetical protein IT448_12140 [Phycisphaerales bacterium]|nr:hypothetical protein [Phycisphaerales bacterium]